MTKNYYTYIATNKSNTLYTGMTNNLSGRMWEHAHSLVKGFTEKYHIDKLVYYSIFDNPDDAIIMEKRIKGWTRKKKMELIKSMNPKFENLLDRL